MAEPDQIEFHEHVGGRDDGPSGSPLNRSIPVRIGIVAGSAILVVVGAVAAMGASPAPSSSTANPGAGGPAPGTPFDGTPPMVAPPGGFGFGFGGGGSRLDGFGDITISSIDGSNLSLKTEDGWTRTINVDSSTKISKAGQAVGIGDLKVGDQIVLGESKASDGSYTINAIRVVLPVVAGQVSAVGADTITLTQVGGGSATIHVGASTTFDVDGKTGAKLSDVTVGSFVVAEGTRRGDGSLDAVAVRGGSQGGPAAGPGGPMFRGGGGGPRFRGGAGGPENPKANPGATPTTPSSAG